MASVVNNLRINGKEVKKIYLNDKILKEFYFNDVLTWKNANPFVFVAELANVDLSKFGADTIIFENFSKNEFVGSYNLVEDADAEKPNLVQGQMIVEIKEK